MADPKTIRIKSSDPENQGDFVVINEDDFDESIHERYDNDGPSADTLRIAKGPGGRIYLKLGKETVSGPFDTMDEAEAALAAETAK